MAVIAFFSFTVFLNETSKIIAGYRRGLSAVRVVLDYKIITNNLFKYSSIYIVESLTVEKNCSFVHSLHIVFASLQFKT